MPPRLRFAPPSTGCYWLHLTQRGTNKQPRIYCRPGPPSFPHPGRHAQRRAPSSGRRLHLNDQSLSPRRRRRPDRCHLARHDEPERPIRHLPQCHAAHHPLHHWPRLAAPFLLLRPGHAHWQTALRYVEWNAVRTHMARSAGAYPWSCARAHLGRFNLKPRQGPRLAGR